MSNQPAFPCTEYEINSGHWEGRYEIHSQHMGLSKREWIIGKVLSNSAICHSGLTIEQCVDIASMAADLVFEPKPDTATAQQIALGIGGAK